MNLPLGLAIALLKDSNGQIDIDLPVAGNMNNPDFSYGGVVWRAIGNMITGIVTAPFRFLGSLLGIKGDDLKAIDFEKGSFIIISTEEEKLSNLQKIMNKRPNIKIHISGGYDENYDAQALQKKEFDMSIKTELRKIKKDTNSSKIDTYGTILKSLFIKEFTKPKYDKLKNSFMIIQKSDNNTSKKSKVKKKPTLDIVAFNNKMQKDLIAKIKITKEKLVNLANKRANAVKEKLVKKYKINQSRIKILTPILQEAKRNKWIGTKIDIAI